MKYRKIPVVVEAFRWSRHTSPDDLPDWFLEAELAYKLRVHFPRRSSAFVEITTLEGRMRAEEGYYIILGVKGEVYPCRADIFKETYELVKEEPCS